MSKDYHDYVIKNGKLIGKFEEMYKECNDPWYQKDMYSERNFYKRLGGALLELKNIKPRNMLDLGCGKGSYTKYLKDLLVIPEVIGLDISKTAIKSAGSRYKDINFKVSNLNDLKKISSSKFDLIVASELFWYVLPYIEKIAEDIKAIIEERGYLFILQHFYQPGEQKYGNNIIERYDQFLDVFYRKGFKIHYILENNRFSNHDTITLFSLR